ncbi:C40 family peptidase [uncultured Romboutsia sp.]|uniref:C40 family peptidase n=1 Tax=uncultured Romboutsia sp. TaxID=1505656 RepID=UPI00266DB3B1|nr:C40 family peptidase [uncultured Romboutsia sp.]
MLNRKIAIGVSVPVMALALSATASFANSNEGTVTADALNVRSGPSTSYGITTKLYKGDKVEILETSNGWHKIKESNGKIGWVSGDYIKVSSGSTSQPSTSTTKATVTATSLNVRSGAGTSYSVITKLPKGTVVDVLESASNGWKKIKTSGGTTGSVSGEYLTTGSAGNSSTNNSTSQTSYKATVNTDSLNMRKGAGTSYSVITKLSNGTVVDVLESASNGWKKIKTSNGTIGWVSGSYLANGVVEQTSTPSTNKVQAVIDLAHKQLGKPYVWGAEGPNSFDCSGLIYYVYKNAASITLPRTSSDQYSAGVAVSRSNLKAGDLIFSSTDGTGNITHVAIYVGDGQMIHAPRNGKNVEKVSINNSYWNKAYVGARRVL